MSLQRRGIYNWGYNPYCYWLSEFIKEQNELTTLIANANKEKTPFKRLNKFLQSIPQAAYWEDSYIEKADVLFISNEPGLTNVKKLYCNFLDNGKIKKDLSICNIASAFHESMLSWLALIDHPNLKAINGERITECCIDACADTRFKKFGKIGYFLKETELKNISIKKCIHIDLFPFAQKLGTWRHKEPAEAISKFLNRSNNNNAKIYNKEIKICNLFKNIITAKIIGKNLQIIIKFLNNHKKDKYIFIIGNRSILNKESAYYYFKSNMSKIGFGAEAIIPFSDPSVYFFYFNKTYSNYTLKDNAIFLYIILKRIIYNKGVCCRLIDQWPSGLKRLSIFEPEDGIIALPNKRVHLTAVPLALHSGK